MGRLSRVLAEIGDAVAAGGGRRDDDGLKASFVFEGCVAAFRRCSSSIRFLAIRLALSNFACFSFTR